MLFPVFKDINSTAYSSISSILSVSVRYSNASGTSKNFKVDEIISLETPLNNYFFVSIQKF